MKYIEKAIIGAEVRRPVHGVEEVDHLVVVVVVAMLVLVQE